MKTIDIHENGIYLRFGITKENILKLLHFSALPPCGDDPTGDALQHGFPFLGMQLSGFDRPYERHGNKFVITSPGYRMKYVSLSDERNEHGRHLTFLLLDDQTNVQVSSHLQFFDGLPLIRFWHEVRNDGRETQTLEYISNFHYEGIEKEGVLPQDEKLQIWVPHNSWQRELNWKRYTLPELGQELVQSCDCQRSSSSLRVSNTGNWSTKEFLPMGFLENTETGNGLFWQIEHNGSWHWEIASQYGHLYLALGGPNELYSHWFKHLKPGDVFTTVPAAVGVTASGLDDAMGTLTDYRRILRRKNEDNEKLPVIFNDYMNCLWGAPTAEAEYPLIDAAAETGCEYFVIDAGWYADGDWWDSVGEWRESRARFPEGLKRVTDYIREKGMIPGVWLEPEVMGIHCKKAAEVPKEWFFLHHGKPVYDRSRFQLDYRNPEVRAYMDGVIDRLVTEYGVGYIKTDYNIEPGIGTEVNADSPGDGMLQHERAYLAWLDGLWQRHPELILENCSSGGLRMDYAMLSRLSIQSTSDLEDYRKYPVIAANAPTGVTPEQAAVWSYPMNHEGTESEQALREETIFNMVNAILLRIHQSGHLAKLDDTRKALVKEGISVYKQIRNDIKAARPFWPLGLASYSDSWVALGLYTSGKAYLAVWKCIEQPSSLCVEIPEFALPSRSNTADSDADCDTPSTVRCIYPSSSDSIWTYKNTSRTLRIQSGEGVMARLFEIS
ncbi:MAG: alpha-galactosidase [Eubacteriales bacterium]|nr:alpha-galactosidase [Eubacteriales bacterium]